MQDPLLVLPDKVCLPDQHRCKRERRSRRAPLRDLVMGIGVTAVAATNLNAAERGQGLRQAPGPLTRRRLGLSHLLSEWLLIAAPVARGWLELHGPCGGVRASDQVTA